jgi:hypothetical protein
MARSTGETDRQRIIRWYRDDLKKYRLKVIKYTSLIETIQERIEALEEKDRIEHDIVGGLPR